MFIKQYKQLSRMLESVRIDSDLETFHNVIIKKRGYEEEPKLIRGIASNGKKMLAKKENGITNHTQKATSPGETIP